VVKAVFPLRRKTVGILAAVVLLLVGTTIGLLASSGDGASRDAWLRPFSSHSIWNTPIGSKAQYVPAGLPIAANGVGFDDVYLIKTTSTDPAVPWLSPGAWTNRCSGSASTGQTLHLPSSLLVPDAVKRADGTFNTPNNAAVFLRPDGHTTDNTSALARCIAGGPVYGYRTGEARIDISDLYGAGTYGSHGASRLSAIGGAIRPGELSSGDPIRHVLDLVLYAKHLSYSGGTGYRWPALSADSYANGTTYTGGVSAMKMGSLLALPVNVTAESVGITSPVALKIFHALQDYGGYVTDDSAGDVNYLGIDKAAVGTFVWGAAEQKQVDKLISMLNVVNNNSATSIGGGGKLRQPLLPALKSS
jgi:hypothetical protein